MQQIENQCRAKIDVKYAHALLAEAEIMNPGKWVAHSRNVARVAERIAYKCNLDAGSAYIYGLLHDIGRRFGVGTIRHGLDGLNYLNEIGLTNEAKICLMHSYPKKDGTVFEGIGDYSDKEREIVRTILNSMEYDEYDRLIQLCDFLALPNGLCPLETRTLDVLTRVSVRTEKFVNNLVARYSLKKHFSRLCGGDIYDIITLNGKERLLFM